MKKKLFAWAASVALLVGVVAEADTLFSALTGGAAVSGTDIFGCYQGSNPAKGCTAAQILTYIQANVVVPISTGVSGLGTGIATFLATPTSANFLAAITDETGTGAVVAANSPALTGTPTAPTAAPATNTTQVATTAFVIANASGVSVTAATPDVVVTPSPGTGTFTIGTTAPLHDISGSGVAIVTGDAGKTDLLGAFTYTLAQAGTTGFTSGWGSCLLNIGAGNATINATTSVFKGAGGSTSLVLVPGAWACPTSDGTNYQTLEGDNIVAGTNITVTLNANGTRTIAASGGSSAPSIPQGRVTLQTGKPLMDADVVAATTLYYDSFEGNQAPVWNGSSMAGLTITSDEISMGLSATHHPANSFHSLFLVNNASALALCTVQWTNGTTPGPAAVSLKNGVLTVSSVPTNCWGGAAGATDLASAISNSNQATLVGCVATTGTNGQTAMQFAPSAAAGGPNTWRGFTNVYNARTKGSEAFDSTASWTIAGTTFAPLHSAAGNGGLGNRVNYFDCIGQLTADAVMTVDNIPATSEYDIYSVCLDSTSSGCATRNMITQSPGANYRTTLTEKWFFGPSLGFHFVQAMEEYFGGAGTTEGGGATGLLVTLPY